VNDSCFREMLSRVFDNYLMPDFLAAGCDSKKSERLAHLALVLLESSVTVAPSLVRNLTFGKGE